MRETRGRMAQLTHAQYDIIERAVMRGLRVAITRQGRREIVVIPRRLHSVDAREAIEASNPVTGLDLTIYTDEIERVEPVG